MVRSFSSALVFYRELYFRCGIMILEIKNLSKSFGPVKVLSDISFSLREGCVLGLTGENGAGKTTLMRCISGLIQPNSGELILDGKAMSSHVSHKQRSSICYMVPQEFTLIPNMTVAENIYLGRELTRSGVLSKRMMHNGAVAVLNEIGANISPDALVDTLSVADRQKIEIAKAFLQKAKLIIFDEPTTVLNSTETQALFRIIRDFCSKGGSAIYISHKLPEVLEICDDVAVLRDGVLVKNMAASEFTPRSLAEAMVGRPLEGLFPSKLVLTEEQLASCPALEVENLSDGRVVKTASFKLYAGEILGLAGLAGAGRTELAELICGMRKRSSGTVKLFGEEVHFTSMAGALKGGLTYLPEDRQSTALLQDFSIQDNITLAALKSHCGVAGFVSSKSCKEATAEHISKLHIKCENAVAPVRTLSGGNQQKVVIAKGLDTQPRVFIFDEPTRGVDVGARSEIYEVIHGLAMEGMAVLLISSDLEEVIGNCNRVMVMREGELAGELVGEAVTEASIMHMAHGV